MPVYVPRVQNVIQKIMADHFSGFEECYDELYAKEYGKYRIIRIKQAVEKFIECGDYSKGIARIKCTNPECGYEYFRPFVASLKEACKSWYLCPSCNQKRLLLFSKKSLRKRAPETPSPTVCIRPAEIATDVFQI